MFELEKKSAQKNSFQISNKSFITARMPSLDLIKWLAFLTMFIDHLRYINPQLSWCLFPGRISFPFFCFVIAANLQRKLNEDSSIKTISSYLLWMFAFFVISEYPYRLFLIYTKFYNVFLTLLLSVLLIFLATRKCLLIKAVCISILLVVVLLSGKIMYGVPGVLLPLAIFLCLRHGYKIFWLSIFFAMAANVNTQMVFDKLSIDTSTLLSALFAAIGVSSAFLIYANVNVKYMPPINRWGYLLYPSHLLVYYAIKIYVWQIIM